MAAAFRYVHRAALNLVASDATHNMSPRGYDNGTIATEANAQALIRQAYTAKNLFAYVSNRTGTYTATLTGRDSGVGGALTVSLTGTGIFEDTSNTMALASGDLFNTQLVTSGIGHSEQLTVDTVALTLEHATDNVGILLASTNTEPSWTSTIGYVTIAGRMGSGATEANVQRTARTAATLAKLFVRCSGVSSPVVPLFSTRVNGASGGQSVAPNAAGTFEDTSGTDTIAVGDEINYSGITTSGTFSTPLAQVQSSSSGLQHVGALRLAAIASGIDYAAHLEGDDGAVTTEAQAQVTMRTTNVLKNFYTYVSAYSLNATPTVRMRINATDNALGVSPNATGVWEDTSNTITLAATDEANYNADTTSASSGNITCQVISVEETQPGGANTEGGEHPFRQEPVRRTFALVAV